MNITPLSVTISQLASGYRNDLNSDVVAYGGKLIVRPNFQREFVYNDVQQSDVIKSILLNRPLGNMYWLKHNDVMELMDGQQRTISICEFVNGNSSFRGRFFESLNEKVKKAVQDYPLQVFVCEGGSKAEEMDWFQTVNMAGEKLNAQEMRNAIFASPWVNQLKKYFSRPFCPATEEQDAVKYINGTAIRQDFLQTALEWAAKKHGVNGIHSYMESRYKSVEEGDDSEPPEWKYFVEVLYWTRKTFKTYWKDMKGVDWNSLYMEFGDRELDLKKIDDAVAKLHNDPYISDQKTIYKYAITGNRHDISLISPDTPQIKNALYNKQRGKCAKCGEEYAKLDLYTVQIVPWEKGGKFGEDNLQMICKDCLHAMEGTV